MTYWTLMLITVLSGPFEDTKTGILYESKDECIKHINTVTGTLSYDYTIECVESEKLSGSIKPQPRP